MRAPKTTLDGPLPRGDRSGTACVDCAPAGGMEIDPDFFVDFHDRPGGPARAHEVRL